LKGKIKVNFEWYTLLPKFETKTGGKGVSSEFMEKSKKIKIKLINKKETI